MRQTSWLLLALAGCEIGDKVTDSGGYEPGPCSPGQQWSVAVADEFAGGVTVGTLVEMAEGRRETTAQLYGHTDPVELTVRAAVDTAALTVDEDEYCRQHLLMPAEFTLQTPDGALDERWSVTIRTSDTDDVGFEQTIRDGSGLAGSLDPADVLADGWELQRMIVYSKWDGSTVRGFIAQATLDDRAKNMVYFDLAIWPFGGNGLDYGDE